MPAHARSSFRGPSLRRRLLTPSPRRFPPLGRRGITGGRVTGFGNIDLPTYIAQANADIRIVPMIESAAGVAALPEILAVPGVALVMEGALDLALDLGLGPQPRHPQVWELLLQLHAQCVAANVPFAPTRAPRRNARTGCNSRRCAGCWPAKTAH